MQKRVLTASAVILACGTLAAHAQQNIPGVPIQEQPQVSPQRQELERLLQRLVFILSLVS